MFDTANRSMSRQSSSVHVLNTIAGSHYLWKRNGQFSKPIFRIQNCTSAKHHPKSPYYWGTVTRGCWKTLRRTPPLIPTPFANTIVHRRLNIG